MDLYFYFDWALGFARGFVVDWTLMHFEISGERGYVPTSALKIAVCCVGVRVVSTYLHRNSSVLGIVGVPC